MNSDSSSNEEQTPLLLKTEDMDFKSNVLKDTKSELFLLIKIALPIIVTNLSTFLILTESIIISGQLSKYDLDGCALANSIINVAGLAVGTGLCTACDTYFSQMYGSKHRKSIGVILIRGIMIISLFPIFLIAIHINMEPIFILLNQHPLVAHNAAYYMLLFSPGLLFGFNFLILTRYMQNQNRVLAPMTIGVIINIFNIVSQYLTVHYFNLGFKASPICQAITFFLFWLIQLGYIMFSKLYKETWSGWTRDSLLDWGSFIKLAIPGAAMVVMECFCFEIGTLLSGIMGPDELAAQSVIFQLETITFMISFGVGIAVNIRVGQFLGSGLPKEALRAYRCGLLIMLLSFCVSSILILGLKDYLPIVFVNDKKAQQLSSDLIPYLVGVQFFDAMGTVTMGALRGCGRQKICVLMIFCSYYLLGQPIGISLAFPVGLKVQGLWIGLLISLAICVPIAVIYTNFIQDWNYQATICQRRIIEALRRQEDEDISLASNPSDQKISFPGEIFTTSHARSLSKSFTTEFPDHLVVTKYRQVHKTLYLKAYYQKSLTLVFGIIVLLCGILIHVYLPWNSYFLISNITYH